VVPITKDSPLAGFETLVDPEDAEASPNGWHSIVANKDLTKTMYVLSISFEHHSNNCFSGVTMSSFRRRAAK
jgi:hypothetical protein